MTDVGRLNAAWAQALVDGFVAAGVRHAVLSPGSRSTPLALACLRHGDLTCRVILDERVAGFFALGLVKALGMPVLLLATSGSAPANWHPAVAEAAAARLPLLLLTTDRPPELQDCGANQTMDQTALFGPQLRAFHALPPAEAEAGWLSNFCARTVSQSRWPLAGPVQINLPFREPLLASEPPPVVAAKPCRVILPRALPSEEDLVFLQSRLSGRRGVILAGAEPLPAAPLLALAERLACPILADPLSGLRFGQASGRVMARADLFVRGDVPAPDWVLRFGAAAVSKTIGQWLARIEAEEITVSGDAAWPDPQRAAAVMIHADPASLADGLCRLPLDPAPCGWLAAFQRAEAAAAALSSPPEAVVIAALCDALPDNSLLFLGNSMAVRDFDAFSGHSAKHLTVLGNRGVSGIDGTLSCFLGAAASGRYARCAALVGDLTSLHDVGGLAAGQGLSGLICVQDNGGGGIFDYLPQAGLPEFQQGWLTPQTADLAAAAAVWGHGYVRGTAGDVAAALQRPGLTILHLPIDRQDSVRRHQALWNAAAQLKELQQ